MGVVLDEAHHLRLEGGERLKAAPTQLIFEITPDALGRIDFGTVRRLEDQHDICWDTECLCAMAATIVHENQIQGVGTGGGQFVQERLHIVRMHPRNAEEKAITIGRCHGAIQPEVVEAVLESANRLGSTQGDAPPTDRMQPKPTLITDPQLHGPLVFGRNRGLDALRERVTKGGYGGGVFFSWLGRTTLSRARSLSCTTVWTA